MFRHIAPLHRLVTALAAAAVLSALVAAPGQAAGHRTHAAIHRLGAHASIIGGYAPHPTQWPWMAAIDVSPTYAGGDDRARNFCGGALIAPRLVLTAAHCMTEKDGSQTGASTLEVVLGKRDLTAAGGEHLRVVAVERHQLWDRSALRHDLALLYLAAPSSATPAALVWQGSSIPSRTLLTVMGWGRTQVGLNDRTVSPTLKAVDLPLLGDGDCAAATTAWSGGTTVYDPATQLCAGWNTGTDSTCKGDSGGPVMFLDSTGTWRLFGVVSYGRPDCDSTAAPTVFAWLGANDMLAFATAGVSRAANLPAPAAQPSDSPSPVRPGQPGAPAATVAGPGVTADRTAPGVRSLRVAPGRVRSGRTMTVRVALDEGGTLTMRLRGPRGALGTGAVEVRAGSNAIGVPARLDRARMRPGHWTLTVVVTDAAGNRSAPATARFRVVR